MNITIDHFKFVQTADPQSALDFVESLAAEGVLTYTSPRVADETPEETENRKKADMASIVTTAMANSAAAFKGGLGIKLFNVVMAGDYAMTTSAMSQSGITKAEELYDVFVSDSDILQAMSQPQASRLKQFLLNTLPALREAGAVITPAHIISLLQDDGGVTITSAIRTIGTIAKANRGKISKEDAQYMADVVEKKIEPTEREVKERLGVSAPTEEIIHGISSITERGTTITFRDLTDTQVRVIVARLRGYADCEGWDT